MLLKFKSKTTLEAWSLYQPYQVTDYSIDLKTNLDLYTALLNFYVQVTSFSLRKKTKNYSRILYHVCLFFPPELITSHTHTQQKKRKLHSQRSSLSPSLPAPCKARPSYPFESRHHHRSGRSNLGFFRHGIFSHGLEKKTNKTPETKGGNRKGTCLILLVGFIQYTPRAQPWPLFLKGQPPQNKARLFPTKNKHGCIGLLQVDEVKQACK